jgi:hypothetical protein
MIYFQVLKAANVTRKAEQWLIVENERFQGSLSGQTGFKRRNCHNM